MDTLYIGDIPKEYHFAVYGSNYIDLYNTSNLQGTLDFYRVYLYDNLFAYEQRTTTYSQYFYSTAQNIDVTDNYIYRRDYPSIVGISFVSIILIVFLFNIVSSSFKRGGLLGGLL